MSNKGGRVSPESVADYPPEYLFNSVEERSAYEPTTVDEIEELYSDVSVNGTMPIGGIALILELFCLCEKQNPDAHQFHLTLLWTKECIEGTRGLKNLLNIVIRHREY